MYSAIRKNKVNTVIIMAGFLMVIGLLAFIASYIFGNGEWSITITTLVIAATYALFQYFAASSQALSMSGAQEIDKNTNPRLYRIVENLAITTGTPMPKVYIINDPSPNAFATGRNPENAAVAATTGLMDLLDDAELQGVMAHELGHVRNYDIRVSTIVFGLVVAIGLLADILSRMAFWGAGSRNNNNNANPVVMIIGLVAIMVAPIVAAVVQAAISRQREYLADATGAMTTRHPEALASALAKIGGVAMPMKRQNSSMAHLWISDPMKPGLMDRMFSTHPPTQDRINRLLTMGGKF